MPIILSAAAPKCHHIRDLVPYVVARIPYVVARPGSDGGETFHGRYKLQSPPSRRRRRLKAAAALISNPLYLPNGGNGFDRQFSAFAREKKQKMNDGFF